MADFDPAQVLPEEETEQITTPISMPNQFGGVVAGAPIDPVAAAAAAQAAQAQQADQIAAQSAYQQQIAGAPPAPGAPAAVVPIPAPAPPPVEPPSAGAAPPPPVAAAPTPVPSAAAAPRPAAPAAPIPGVPTPGQQMVQTAERQGLNEEARENQAGKTELTTQEAAQAAKDATRVAAQAAQDQKDLEHAQSAGQAFVQHAQDHYEERAKAYQDAIEAGNHSNGPFDKKGTFGTAAGWLGLALGTIGASFSAAGGHPTGNLAVTQLNKQMDDEFAKQRARISDMHDQMAMAQTGLKNAGDAKQSLLMDLLARQKAAYGALEAQAKSQAAGYGVPEAALNGSDLMTTLRQKQLEADTQLQRQAQTDYLTRLKTAADVRKSNAEAGEAGARSKLLEAQASGAIGLPGGATVNVGGGFMPGSKPDKAIMSTYINPARKDAAKDKARVTMLSGLDEALKDPNLTYGQAKQILINGFTAAGGNPGGRIAVADIHEVLPGMQSTLEKFVSDLDQGSGNRVSPEFRKVVGQTIAPELKRWTTNYETNKGALKKTLSMLPPEAQEHYAGAIYPELPSAAPAAAPTYPLGARATSGGKPVVMTANGWQPAP